MSDNGIRLAVIIFGLVLLCGLGVGLIWFNYESSKLKDKFNALIKRLRGGSQ